MTHQQTIRIISPVLLTGLLSGVPMEATLAETGIVNAPTLQVNPLPAPNLPSIPASPSTETQEETIQPTEQVSPAVDESPTSEAPSDVPTDMVEISASNLVDIAMQEPESFSIFLQALEASGLKETLLARQDLTVFMPTNAAFEALPEGVVASLLQPENQQILAKIMTHHVLEGVTPAANLTTQDVQTLANSKAAITVTEESVAIDDATVVRADIPSSNGMVHVIDSVLIPAEIR